MIEDGRAFRLSKNPPSIEKSSDGAIGRFPNLLVVNREHSERPKQTKKRTVKPERLIMTIPREGARAKEILTESKK